MGCLAAVGQLNQGFMVRGCHFAAHNLLLSQKQLHLQGQQDRLQCGCHGDKLYWQLENHFATGRNRAVEGEQLCGWQQHLGLHAAA
jgi:hypothetical protein